MNHALYPFSRPVKGPNTYEWMETSYVKEEPRLRTLRSYPRCIRPGFEPFDPVELASETEKIVTAESQQATRSVAASGASSAGSIGAGTIPRNSGSSIRLTRLSKGSKRQRLGVE